MFDQVASTRNLPDEVGTVPSTPASRSTLRDAGAATLLKGGARRSVLLLTLLALVACEDTDKDPFALMAPTGLSLSQSGTDHSHMIAIGDSVHTATPKEPVPGTPGTPGTPGFYAHPNDPSQPCPWDRPGHPQRSRCVWNPGTPGTPGTPGDPDFVRLKNLTPAILRLNDAGYAIATSYGLGKVEIATLSATTVVTVLVPETGSPPVPPQPPVGEEPVHLTIRPLQATFPVGYTFQFRPSFRDAAGNEMASWNSQAHWYIRKGGEGVASVDQQGNVTGLSEGSTRVYVEWTNSNGEKLSKFAPVTIASAPLASDWMAQWNDFPLPSTTVTVPTSIDATGKTDVTAALQSWLNSVPNNRVVQFNPGATYRVETGLRLEGRSNLVIDGRGARFIQDDPTPFDSDRANRNRSVWDVIGGENLVFRNVVIRGPNAAGGTSNEAWVSALEAQHGINVRGVRGMVIEDTRITHVYGDLIYVGSNNGPTRRLKIRRNVLSHSGRQGIAFNGAEDVIIGGSTADANTIEEIRRSLLDFEPTGMGGSTRRVLISHNRIGSHRLNFIAAGGKAAHIEYIEVMHNRFHNDGHLRIQANTPEYHIGYYRNNWRIVGNYSEKRAARRLIAMDRMTDILIENNHNPMQRSDNYGLEGTDLCRVTVRNNSFPGGGGDSDYTLQEGCTK